MPPGGATWPASRRRGPIDPDLDDLPALVPRDVLDHREGGEVRSNASQPALARAPAAVLLERLVGDATGPYLAEDPVRAKQTAGPPAALDAGGRAVRAALRRRGLRSEERRVGTEGRSGRCADHFKERVDVCGTGRTTDPDE